LLRKRFLSKNLLKNPIGSHFLRELIQQKGAEEILIIVNNVTRPIPYKIILPPLLKELRQIRLIKNFKGVLTKDLFIFF
jgi:nickel-dependent lactate racemase